MTNLNKRPENKKETLSLIDDSNAHLDELRFQSLQKLKQQQLMKHEIFILESKRIANKNGKNDSRIEKIDNRLAFNQGMFNSLDNEIEKAKIKTERLPENAWRIHGFVFDQNDKRLKGVTFFLSDVNTNWIEYMGNSFTNESGYYSLTVNEAMIDKWTENKKPDLFISVSNDKKELIYFSKDPIDLSKGFIDQRDVYLISKKGVPPPLRNEKNIKKNE